MATLVSAFILSSWFPEKLPVAPYLALVGMPGSGKTTVLRLLEMLCRHSSLVTDITSAGFYQLYDQTTPTLLIDETNTAADQKKLAHLLRSGSTPGALRLQKNLSFSCYGPKAFAWTDMPRDRALITRCILIPMHETDRTDLKRVTDPSIQSAAEDLQKQFLQLRLERFGTSANFEVIAGPQSRNRDLYEALTFALAGDKNVCEELASLLSEQEQFTREGLSVGQAAVLIILITAMHSLTTFLVGDLTKWVDRFLASQNERVRLTPHTVGKMLTSFGIYSKKRTNRGWEVEVDQARRRSVHVLFEKYQMENNIATMLLNSRPFPWAPCSICNEFNLTTKGKTNKASKKLQ
jgi:hypothetical protein